VLGCAVMAKLEKRFVDLGESEAREVIKSAVAVGVFQGGLLLSLLGGLFALAMALIGRR
jgi:hypothetical protein